MSVTIRKGLLGKEDIKFYTAASPTFSRTTSTGGSTTVTALSASHIPLVQGAASLYFTQNTVQRGMSETISRYFQRDHSIATYAGGARVGDHRQVFGFRNALAATSLQAAASNQFLSDGIARIFVPNGTITAATAINLPRICMIYGNGHGSIIRANATNKVSRVLSISGAIGATSSDLTANATIGTSTVAVSNGGSFSVSQYVRIRDSKNSEIQRIKSIAGNTLTMFGSFRHTYRSAATVKDATIAYPAKIWMDNLLIQGPSDTALGHGIAATVMLESTFGPGLTIEKFAPAGMKFNSHCNENTVDAVIRQPAANTSGMGYGVFLADATSYDNRLGGVREGTNKDVSNGGVNNFVFASIQNGSSAASGLVDPYSFWYRTRKPELSYATYGSTVVLTCPADANAPSEVYINGRVYQNRGTVLSDLSRTKVPAQATVGGLDRGPATATRSYYAYAVPTLNPSATRQWDLMVSSQSPATGPLASSTFPVWSYLGAMTTGATVRLRRFTQSGDKFIQEMFNYLSDGSLAAAQATWKSMTSSCIPVGTKHLSIMTQMIQPAQQAIAAGYQVVLGNNDATNINHFSHTLNMSGSVDGNERFYTNGHADIPITNRRFKYRNNFPVGGGTINLDFYFGGFTIDRAGYK